jgi:Cu/Ag efflux protein CusF
MTRIKTFCLSLFVALVTPLVAFADTPYFYTVKGIVKGMPGDGRAPNEILVKHQAIPEYRDEDGVVTGMMAMTMPFYLAEGVSLSGIKAGDSVELKIEQHLKPSFTEAVAAIKKVE